MTTDVFLTFLVTLALYCLIGVVQRGWTRDYVFSGIVIGLATATKFSALPLLAPLAVACLVRVARGDRFLPVLRQGRCWRWCGSALAFAVGQPYAFLDFASYYHDIEEQSRMVREAGRLPYTNQYIGVPKYGYDLTAAGAVGHGAAARAGRHLGDRLARRRRACASAPPPTWCCSPGWCRSSSSPAGSTSSSSATCCRSTRS